jgi:oligoribonuclease NrnB/cAMP/cGMP phosphodiesterase (DHH superfamily)
MKKVSIVSHRADLDGVASAVLASEFVMSRHGVPPDKVIFADYEDAKTAIARAAIDADELWILDLSIRESNISEFFKHIPKESVFYFDHHNSSVSTIEAWSDKVSIYFDDSGNCCTADLLYAATPDVAPAFVKTPVYDQIVAATHSRELWINDVAEGALLTDAIAILGAETVYQELLEQPSSAFESKFPELFQEAVVIADNQRKNAMSMANNTKMVIPVKDGCSLVYSITTGYQSEVGHMILQQHPGSYAIMFNLGNLTASVRCDKATADANGIGANSIASLFVGGGGHPVAAGFPLTADMSRVILQSGCMSTHNAIARLFGKR